MPLTFQPQASDVMTSTELIGFWFDDDNAERDVHVTAVEQHDLDQLALEQLAERVSAARSVY